MTLTNITKIFQRPYIFVTHSFFFVGLKKDIYRKQKHTAETRIAEPIPAIGPLPRATRDICHRSLCLPVSREMPCYHKIEETLAHGYTVVAPPAESKLYDMPSDLQMRTGPVVSLTIYRINSMGTVHHLVRGVPRARQRRR